MNDIATLKYKTVNNEVFAKYIKLKEELSIIEEENKVKKEEKILASWESLFGNMSGEVEEDEEETPTFEQFQLQLQEDDEKEEELDGLEVDIEFPQMIDETVVPIQEEKEEIVEEEQQQQETTTTTTSTVEDFASLISEEEKNKPKVLKEDPIAIKIRKLEDMLRQLAMQSPGGGEVRLLNLDDVDTTNLANDKILKYTSSSGKLGFVSEAAVSHEVTAGSTSITTAMSGVAINTQILDTPAGYVSIEVDGTTYKLPYYPE
jgi:hypothetical protein